MMLVQFFPVLSILFSLVTLLHFPYQPQYQIETNPVTLFWRPVLFQQNLYCCYISYSFFIPFASCPKSNTPHLPLDSQQSWSLLLLQYNRIHGSMEQAYFPPFLPQTYLYSLSSSLRLSCTLESHEKIIKFPIPRCNSREQIYSQSMANNFWGWNQSKQEMKW